MKIKFLGNGSGFSETHTNAYFTVDNAFIQCVYSGDTNTLVPYQSYLKPRTEFYLIKIKSNRSIF